jgi:SAM-dependent methyltransferase
MSFNSSRYYLQKEVEQFARAVPANALVLDAGAGLQPYKHLFTHARYESADFEKLDLAYTKTTYVCDLQNIPVEDCRYDCIIFNQVMEHLPEPGVVLKELHRVLKQGGKLFYSGPLFYEEHHQPYDFFRFTQFGLRFLFSQQGFEIERMDWLEGYFGTVGYQLKSMAAFLPGKTKELGGGVRACLLIHFLIAVKFFSSILSPIFHKLDVSYKITWQGYPKNYVLIAVKPFK